MTVDPGNTNLKHSSSKLRFKINEILTFFNTCIMLRSSTVSPFSATIVVRKLMKTSAIKIKSTQESSTSHTTFWLSTWWLNLKSVIKKKWLFLKAARWLDSITHKQFLRGQRWTYGLFLNYIKLQNVVQNNQLKKHSFHRQVS